jgi:hypothetical protein
MLAFLFSGLPLPTELSDRMGLTPLLMASFGAPAGNTGGNLAQEYAALTFLGAGQGDQSRSSHPQPDDRDCGKNGDITYERYLVQGDTLEELQAAIKDPQTGLGPYDEEEGKRYAAYVQAEYEVTFSPVVKGCWREGGEVAVELGAQGTVRPRIHMQLPEFKPSDPELECACNAEEARIEKHEMEHVAVFRLCGEELEDSLSEVRAKGKGPNLWIALISARFELDEIINLRLDKAIEMANCMNIAIDKLTNHGLGLLIGEQG